MAALAFPRHIHTAPKPSFFNNKPKTKLRTRISVQSSLTPPQLGFSDPFVLELAEALEDSLPSPSSSKLSPLEKIRDVSSETLLSTPWPSRKDEPFRFTDTSFIKNSKICPVSRPPPQSLEAPLASPEDTQLLHLAIVDGHIVDSSSNMSGLPDGVYVGSLSNATSESLVKRVGEFVCGFDWGDLFWSINGVGAPDLAVVYVPAGCRVENAVHLRYYSVEASDVGSNKLPVSNPRVFVVVEKGGEVDIVEEFMGGDPNRCYWANPVLEVVVGEGGKVRHSYVQNQSPCAAHIKWTSVRQDAESSYQLVEVSSGGKLSRHNLHVQQLGPDTVTELSTLHLAFNEQTQDLHSRLVLDYPRGSSRQLHKCIVANSQGQAVFDGNVKVNRDLR
ncbi:protein ABCI7, chloroplastic isoform X2 [Rhodamnia argentea]|uniref:Protein ABCI7, chloroplastic isoform X2 n=1 Tax=Rhodamnia argentea TaxID=178133 RepID=A0ABM3H555_9MYRT|nr:protein ABCI7, chloroplastic isoform X2 [Rhodamnia argentea]